MTGDVTTCCASWAVTSDATHDQGHHCSQLEVRLNKMCEFQVYLLLKYSLLLCKNQMLSPSCTTSRHELSFKGTVYPKMKILSLSTPAPTLQQPFQK